LFSSSRPSVVTLLIHSPERLIRNPAEPAFSPFGQPTAVLRACRTPDQVVRSHLLYPAELRMRAEREYIEVTRDGHPKISSSLAEKCTCLAISPEVHLTSTQ